MTKLETITIKVYTDFKLFSQSFFNNATMMGSNKKLIHN